MNRCLVLVLSIIGLTLSANATSTDLLCAFEDNSEFHLLVDPSTGKVIYSEVYLGKTRSREFEANYTDTDVTWSSYESDRDYTRDWSLSRDTGHLSINTKANPKTGILAGTIQATCKPAAKVF